ncbi:transposase [Candidatus Bathyarchaeota archaeon]|nr:transposase [Candidatus Bathyarchaeota archaeon]
MLSRSTIHFIWASKYRRKVFLDPVEVRLLEVLKTIASQNDFEILAAKLYDGDHFLSCRMFVF